MFKQRNIGEKEMRLHPLRVDDCLSRWKRRLARFHFATIQTDNAGTAVTWRKRVKKNLKR